MDSNGSCEWRHVPSGDNPADALSRGQLTSEFTQNNLWQHGPYWLKQTSEHWPQQLIIQTPTDDSETKRITCLHTMLDESLFKNFNSFTKLIRTFAHCFRLADIIKGRQRRQGELSATELQETRARVLRLVQSSVFSTELQHIKQTNENRTPHHHKLRGRLNKAQLSDLQRHPIILPKNHIITDLIILEEHLNNLHAGVQGTLYNTRQTYWVLDGRNQIRRVIRKCVTCVRAHPPPTNYLMGHLLAARVSRTIRPFVHVGVDYCGPFYMKDRKFRNRNQVKVYVAVFICLAVKAVHLEVVSDLTSSGFCAALDRFISRRGKPTLIESDNGTNFTGANNELKRILAVLQQPDENDKISRILINQGIQWKFTPPLSPHFGGIWEAAVKSFKHHAVRFMGLVLFTFEEFNTLVIQIEDILTSRPLTPISADPNDLQALIPAHFLIGDTFTNRPELNLMDERINRLTRWELVQKLKQDFWTRWHKEYLNELNIRKKWTTGSHDIKEDSVVLLRDDNLPPMQWKLGRVVKTYPGEDGIIRVVDVKTATGVLKRNIKRVSPLPVSSPTNDT
ncbi:uncharacterized protein LOC135169802 [Diachasmimorpha longicaudata]|uniref:uncharacterized protein LOC135169802 n=1 Tax=Diachasmimorpha longicaudata TaxID=58733 RepID=UPI0030B8A9D9